MLQAVTPSILRHSCNVLAPWFGSESEVTGVSSHLSRRCGSPAGHWRVAGVCWRWNFLWKRVRGYLGFVCSTLRAEVRYGQSDRADVVYPLQNLQSADLLKTMIQQSFTCPLDLLDTWRERAQTTPCTKRRHEQSYLCIIISKKPDC